MQLATFFHFYIRIFTAWFLISLISFAPVFSQKKKAKNSIDVSYGDEYYKNGDYFKAEEYYQNAYQKQPNSSYIAYRIAECNRLLFKYGKAEEFYARTIHNTSATADYPLAKYWYAVMLKMNGKYQEAIAMFDQFAGEFQPKTPEDQVFLAQAKIDREGCEFAIAEIQKPLRDYRFAVLPQPVNTRFSDYAPAIWHHDSSIVITSAREQTVGGNTYGATGEAFSDNLRFEKTRGGTWTRTNDKDQFQELVNSKYNDGAGVFTHDKKKFYFTQCNDDNGACGIYVTRFGGGKWSKPVKLNDKINDPGGWNAQPSLNLTGDTMFFVSKRAGGAGQHDIWYSVAKEGEEMWDSAVNLKTVNTPFIDMAPNYFPRERTLFFSSTGRKGFGGLDIFMAKGEGYSDISNLGLPFNSNKDDFYFVVGDSLGYLTSNRDGGEGSDDIYAFRFRSLSSQLLAINPDTLDSLTLSVSVKGKIVDDQTNRGVPDLENILADEEGNILKKSKTNKEGDFRYENLDKNRKYKVMIDEDKASLTKKKNYKVANVRIEGSKVKPSRNLFENIYFDYDRAELRPEAIKVLDELAEYLNQNPSIQVELKGNTDAIGTNKYNIGLSRKRGDAAMDYLVSKGVDRSAMVVDAEGEGKPVATNKNEIGRQLNRRVEFYILGKADFQSSGMVYILQPKNTLYSIAKDHGMTVDELKRFNGLDGEDIKAYSPIRVPKKNNGAPVDPLTEQDIRNVNRNANTGGNYKILMEGEEFYVVKAGDTAFSVATAHGMGIDELKEMNGLSDSNLKVGQKIKVKLKK